MKTMHRITWVMLMAAAPVVGLAACGDAPTGDGDSAPRTNELVIAWVQGELPALDPLAKAWDQAAEVAVELLPQDVLEPRVQDLGSPTLRLRALHDGRSVAFRLEWEDATAESLINMDRSTDAVAIQLPATGTGGPLPDAMMGEAGKPVAIAQWRFGSQERLEGKPHAVAALYPNATNDHYPFEGAKDLGTRALMERRYAHARAAGDPVAVEKVTSAVQDLLAEGFGTLTFATEQRSQGKGVHKDGKWTVTITRPLDVEPGSKTALRPGAASQVAVAVWNGGKAHTGSKKMRSIWVPVEVEQGVQP